MRKVFEIIKYEAIMYFREFFSFFFTFIFPPAMLLLYGSTYGNEPSKFFGGLGSMDASVPAFMAMIVGVTGLMAFPLTISSYKENKVYKRFDATPVGKGKIIAAQAVVNFIMTLLGFLLLFLVGKLFYNVKMDGNWFITILMLILSICAIFSLGFLFTAITSSTKMSNLLCYVTYFVMIFISGATMPKEMLPEAVNKFAKFLPLTHVVKVMQSAFWGKEFRVFQSSALVLGVIFVVCLSLGAILYKKKSWT